MLEKSIKFVDAKFGKKPHFERTLYWLLQLDPNADEAMQIAAYCHDVKREAGKIDTKCFLADLIALKEHQDGGGQIMYDFLIDNGASADLAEKVKNLISNHEIGGTDDQNLIKDADSVSYFETNAAKHATWTDKFSKAEIKAKLDFMFDRITSQRTKDLSVENYKKALEILNGAK